MFGLLFFPPSNLDQICLLLGYLFIYFIFLVCLKTPIYYQDDYIQAYFSWT